MVSADGRFVISYNGEVYSHQPIAAELAASGHKFRGHSDTEAILESFAANGIEPTLKRMIGMFAIALWDRRERTLTLIRDRLGIKPLYWARFGKLFLFGSELKALRAHPGWTPRIDRNAVAAFMRHNYIPAPHTIYQGVHKLEPGSILTLPWQGEPRISCFWDARAGARDGMLRPLEGSDDELTGQLETLLLDAISRRMIEQYVALCLCFVQLVLIIRPADCVDSARFPIVRQDHRRFLSLKRTQHSGSHLHARPRSTKSAVRLATAASGSSQAQACARLGSRYPAPECNCAA